MLLLFLVSTTSIHLLTSFLSKSNTNTLDLMNTSSYLELRREMEEYKTTFKLSEKMCTISGNYPILVFDSNCQIFNSLKLKDTILLSSLTPWIIDILEKWELYIFLE